MQRKTILIVGMVLIVLLITVAICFGFMMVQTSYLPASGDITEYPTSASLPTPYVDSLAGVDDILNQALTGSLAYNAPDTMHLEDLVTIQLLLNPSITEVELGQQVEESGTVVTGTIEITPLMKAELIARDEAFTIVPLHDDAIQPISATQTTRWQWQVTAKQEGTQHLTVVVYMLVKYDGREYWREVETYRNDIIVNVTFAQRLRAFDWKWLIGLLITSGAIPFVWRWIKNHLPSRKSPPAE